MTTLRLDYDVIRSYYNNQGRTLLSLHFFKYNSFSMGSTPERVSLPSCSQVGLLIIFVVPSLISAMVTQLSGSPQATWFT